MTNKTAKQRQLLLDLRSQMVSALHTYPYTIYKDSDIENLLKAQPKSIAELGAVKGFPKQGKRVKGFGESIVKIFTDTDNCETTKIKTNTNGDVEISVCEKMNAF